MALDEAIEQSARKAADLSVFKCFGGVGVFIVHAYPKEVAGAQEANDLPSPVQEQFVKLETAAGESEDPRRGLAFIE
jgi:hypothetical protein